jgi:hypothetical protein
VDFAEAHADPEGLVWQVRNFLLSFNISWIKFVIFGKISLFYKSLFFHLYENFG